MSVRLCACVFEKNNNEALHEIALTEILYYSQGQNISRESMAKKADEIIRPKRK